MKKFQSLTLFVLLLLTFIPSPDQLASAQSGGTTVTLQPDGGAMKDTQIVSSTTGTNYETSTELGVGESNAATSTARSLLEFDLTGLPYDMHVISATLQVVVDQDLSDNPRTLYAYAIMKNWYENQASWNQADFTDWATPGASGATDFVAEPIGSVELADDLAPGDVVTILLDTHAVESMRRGNYYGFKLQMDTESDDEYVFRSSDHSIATDRPKIIIEYDSVPLADPGWVCEDEVYGVYGDFPDCPSSTPISPYSQTGEYALTSYGTGRGLAAAQLQCEPFPLCQNDYKIYYRVTYQFDWTMPPETPTSGPFANPQFWLIIPGGSPGYVDVSGGYIDCGDGHFGSCSGTFDGIIDVTDLPSNYDGPFTAGLFGSVDSGVWAASSEDLNYSLFLSLVPFNQGCADTWFVPVPDTYTIDPLLEAPQGLYSGDPVDHQVYPTVVGEVYMVRVNDGPWNDGTDDRTDAAVSFDGETWLTWDEFADQAVCIDMDIAHPDNNDYRILYFEAPTEEFHIRVNDIEGSFGDNTNDNDPPYGYTIGIAFANVNSAACETQFAYDTVDDLVATLDVDSTSDDVQATEAESDPPDLKPGAWYAIEVADGTWNEPGDDPRIDMEFKFDGGIGVTPWADLAADSDLVWCASTDGKTVFIQAPTNPLIELHLRVNDQDLDFSNNTGTLQVNIYHAAFTRIQTGCELQFDLQDLLLHDAVDGNASSGKSFGKYPTELDLLTLHGEPIISIYTGDQFLLPGAWYALDTVEGPWLTTTTYGERTANTPYYDMQIKVGDDDWTDLATWDGAQCIVPTDGLGHVRVFFQVPDDANMGDKSYLLRVASNAFMFTRGYMAYDLYGAIDYGYGGATGDCSSYKYDPDAPKQIGQVNSAAEGGSYISGLGTGSVFAVQIESQDSGWREDTAADESDDLQISVDGGATWATLPNSPAVLCYFYTPEADELVFFIRVLNGQQWKLRADSTTFSDNVGMEDYTVYEASPGGDVNLWTSCIKDYPLALPAINPHAWIPVEKGEGILITSLAQYAEYNGLLYEGAQLPPEIWKDPDASGNYVIEIEYGTGPWDDGETDAQHYDAQLSKDNGATWETLNADSTIVVCSTVDQLRHYWKALIHVDEGDVWKIRVADDSTTTFSDNTGNLAYVLYTAGGFEVPPADNSNIGYISVQGGGDVCEAAPITPGSLDFTDIDALGTYLGDWIAYANLEVERYMAFCPRHVDMFFTVFDLLKKKEPFATMSEFGTMEKDIKRELQSYGWNGEGEDLSFIWGTKNSGQIQAIVDRYVMSDNGGDPWADGAQLIDLHPTSLPASYAACKALLPEYQRFAEGLCFSSSMMKETSAQFWIQLSFDVSAMLAFFWIIGRGLVATIAMATGVSIANGGPGSTK